MDTTYRHFHKQYHFPPWQVAMRRTITFEPQPEEDLWSTSKLRQLKLTDMKGWSLDFTKKRKRDEHEDNGDDEESVPTSPPRCEEHEELLEKCAAASGEWTPTCGSEKQRRWVTNLPSDVLGVVADYFCDGVDDVVLFGRVSKWWFACVIHSFMWKERVAQLTSRNPFPVNERDHHKWHFDVTNASHIMVMKTIIQQRINATKAVKGKRPSLRIWLRLPHWYERSLRRRTEKSSGVDDSSATSSSSSSDSDDEAVPSEERSYYSWTWMVKNFLSGLRRRNKTTIAFKMILHRFDPDEPLRALDVASTSDFVVSRRIVTIRNGDGEAVETDDDDADDPLTSPECGFYKQKFELHLPSVRALSRMQTCSVTHLQLFTELFERLSESKSVLLKQLDVAISRGEEEPMGEDISEEVVSILTAPSRPEVAWMGNLTHLALTDAHFGQGHLLPRFSGQNCRVNLNAFNFALFPKLEYLKLEYPVVVVPPQAITAPAVVLPPQLHTLELYGFYDAFIPEEPQPLLLFFTSVISPSSVCPIPNLKRLAIGTNYYPGPELISAIANFTKLQELSYEVAMDRIHPSANRLAISDAPTNLQQSLRDLRSLHLKCPCGFLTEFCFFGTSKGEDEETTMVPFPALRSLRCDYGNRMDVIFKRHLEFRRRVAGNLHLSFPENTRLGRIQPMDSFMPTLNMLTTVRVTTKTCEELVTLHKLPHLAKLSIDDCYSASMMDEVPGTYSMKASLGFMTTIHQFPALVSIRFEHAHLTAGWHAFNLSAVRTSFFNASMGKGGTLRHVHIKRCVQCTNVSDDDDDFISFRGVAATIGPCLDESDILYIEEEEVREQIVKKIHNRDGTQGFFRADKPLPTESDVYEYVKSCGRCASNNSDLKALRRVMGCGAGQESWFNRSPDDDDFGVQHFRCELELRRALLFWKSVHPKLKFTIGDELGDLFSFRPSAF